MRMLARRPLSAAEIRERLAAKGFAGPEAGTAVSRLAELGLVDDAALCARLVVSFREDRRYGPRKAAAALLARGFARDLVASALREAYSPRDEADAAAAALRKRFRDGVPPGREGAARAIRFLLGRGFGPEACRLAVRRPGAETGEGEGRWG